MVPPIGQTAHRPSFQIQQNMVALWYSMLLSQIAAWEMLKLCSVINWLQLTVGNAEESLGKMMKKCRILFSCNWKKLQNFLIKNLKKAEKDSVRLCKIGQYRRLSNPCTLPNSSLTAIEKTLKNFPICHNFLSHHLIVWHWNLHLNWFGSIKAQYHHSVLPIVFICTLNFQNSTVLPSR